MRSASPVLIVFYFLFHFSCVSNANRVRYDNHKVHRVVPKNVESLELLEYYENELIFWKNSKLLNEYVDVQVPPKQEHVLKTIPGLDYLGVYVDNVQDLIDLSEKGYVTRNTTEFGWKKYHNLEEINAWLASLPVKFPKICKLVQTGSTYEGRKIFGVHLSFNANNKKKTVFIEGGIHANEWIGTAVATYILNELLTSTNYDVRKLAESHDWYIVPVFNADGYAYTHSTDRMWRKTRVPYGGSCIGADPNRNWDYHFNEGVQKNCSSMMYPGPEAFSEPSTRTLSQFISSIGEDLYAYLSFHSYGQKLLIPYGYTSEHLDNYDELFKVGLKAVKSLARRYGTQFGVGNVPELLYIASGGSNDWVKGNFKPRITYTYELRDNGKYGHLLPPQFIVPTGEEVLDSFVTIFNEFEKLY